MYMYVNARLFGNNETMPQNIQSVNEQNVDNVQYKINRTILQMKLRGHSR
jgi:hypothetical protein